MSQTFEVHGRRTGRTTRMLQSAQQLESEGRAVYVIAANAREVKRLRSLLPEDTTIKVETPSTPGNFDWSSMTLMGAHPNCRVLADHFAIESWLTRYARIFEELHRYDLKGG